MAGAVEVLYLLQKFDVISDEHPFSRLHLGREVVGSQVDDRYVRSDFRCLGIPADLGVRVEGPHYTTEWIRRQEGTLRDITLELGGEVNDHPIDFMSTHTKSYKQLADANNIPRAALDLKKIEETEAVPGSVSVILKEGTSSQTLVTRNLEAREILSLGITCPSSAGTSADGGSSISIRVDTLRTWTEEEYTIGSGQGDPGVSSSEAYSVSQAKEHAGEKGVWVCGYIVGGDLSSSKNGIKFEPPFESMTCIAIASRSSVSEKSSCMSVQLVKGDFREALNLVEHPELIGRKVYLKGDIEASYYGIPGLKNLTGYSFN